MWSENEVCACQAAWQFSTVLREFEGELRALKVSLPAGSRPHDGAYDWVWAPFEEPFGSTIHRVAAQAARLIDTGFAPPEPVAADPRLLIPLCAIKMGGELKRKELETNYHRDFEIRGLLRDMAAVGHGVEPRKGDIEKIVPWFLRGGENPGLLHKMLRLCGVTADCEFRLRCLPQKTQFDLVERIWKGPEPTKRDWTQVFRPIDYTFRRSWHHLLHSVLMAGLVAATIVSISILGASPWVGLFNSIPFAAPMASQWLLPLAGAALSLCVGVYYLVRGDIDVIGTVYSIALIAAVILVVPILLVVVAGFSLWTFAAKVEGTTSRLDHAAISVIGTLTVIVLVVMAGLPLALVLLYVTALASIATSWPFIALGWVSLALLFFGVWRAGLRRHRESQNPLRNILDGQVISSRPPRRSSRWHALLTPLRFARLA
jgi:hypothetical protein